MKIALVGNPNTGKTSLFNALTGLSQRVGNYPGVTVDKKEGSFAFHYGDKKATIIDLPGTYSLNPHSRDETIATRYLLQAKSKEVNIDLVLVVADVQNLKRNLLLYSQVRDLNIPAVLVINMADRIPSKGIQIDIEKLRAKLNADVFLVSSKKGTGLEDLKNYIETFEGQSFESFSDLNHLYSESKSDVESYADWLEFSIQDDSNATKRVKHKEVIHRYKMIDDLLDDCYNIDIAKARSIRAMLDRFLLNRFLGLGVFFLILLLIFQAIYNWSSIPMDFIDETFAGLSSYVQENLPAGLFTDLLSEGIISGIGGVVIFIPQIAFLFFFISLLEESGYMSRVVFLTDKFMRKFGLSGKSIVPLISGTACAIPAVMATRNIESWKDRLITILVTPFTTCSARLPVYLIIISIIIPEAYFLGFNYQAIALLVMYLLGFFMAIISAYILSKTLKMKSNVDFIIEMPDYKIPLLKNILFNVYHKTRSFVVDAGKIILALSIIIWFLASHGASDEFNNADQIITEQYASSNLTDVELENKIASFKIEHSYIGVASKVMEPIIQPLGYDWKIGIAVISSFAAREVFVGSLATIYSVGSEEQETIKNRMIKEKRKDGSILFDLATGISLLLFYAFSMQCISTIAIVKKETGWWKWPAIQFFIMTGFAYLTAFIAYQTLK